jgi:hypothetical protein
MDGSNISSAAGTFYCSVGTVKEKKRFSLKNQGQDYRDGRILQAIGMFTPSITRRVFAAFIKI